MRATVPASLLALALLISCAAPTAAPTIPPTGAAPTAAPTATPPAAALSLAGPAGPVAAYGLAELTIATDIVFANPFDPAEADLRVRFTAPSGEEALVPAFWYQPYDPQTLQPSGEPGWRARFTPTAPGAWRARAELASPAAQSEPLAFTVAADPRARGFVRVDRANPRYFAFDSGEPYLPIGANIAWASSLERTIPDYQRWFAGLGQNGGNVARVWMASWSLGIEWKDTGLGDYRGRMRQAYLLDQVFEIAREHDIYIMLCLLNHGAFSTSTNPEWDGNPYSAANGGMLAGPAEFATDERARELFKRRVRYIAARWGYSTNLFAWEWWNEVNWTPIGDDALFPWLAEMTPYLLQFDPNRHLVSSSYATGADSPLWARPEMDFAQQHDYGGGDPVRVFRDSIAELRATAPDKPALLAEHGYSAGGAEGGHGRERIHLHNGIWAPVFLGYAGSGMAWWWDSFIDPNGLWSEYRPLATFLAGERLGDLAPVKAGAGSPEAYALSLQGAARALVWLRSRDYDAQKSALAYSAALTARTAGPDWAYEPPMLSGLTLTIAGLDDGDYTARWLSPQTGEWLGEAIAVASAGGALALPIPDFSRDLAVKIVPAAP